MTMGTGRTAGAERHALLVVTNTAHGREAQRPIAAPSSCAASEGYDRLIVPTEGARFLEALGLDVPVSPPSAEQVTVLRGVRSAVRALAAGDDEAYRRGVAWLASARSSHLGGDGPAGWDAFIAGLLAPLTELHAVRDRVKRCANAACGWVFVDETRGRNQVWCTEQGCGVRHRVREFRRRRRLAETAA